MSTPHRSDDPNLSNTFSKQLPVLAPRFLQG